MKRFELPKLPYEYNLLQPVISAETLQFHHDKHHQAYVDKLNELLPGSGLEEAPLDEIVKKASGPLFNNAAQHWNHDFYWKSMTAPKAGREPSGKLLDAIRTKFSSFNDFKTQFEKQGVGLFGSGWVWLVADSKGELQITQGFNADNPLKHGQTPLITCDVWEHAYYIDYRNARAKYLSRFWEVMNWDFAAENYNHAK